MTSHSSFMTPTESHAFHDASNDLYFACANLLVNRSSIRHFMKNIDGVIQFFQPTQVERPLILIDISSCLVKQVFFLICAMTVLSSFAVPQSHIMHVLVMVSRFGSHCMVILVIRKRCVNSNCK